MIKIHRLEKDNIELKSELLKDHREVVLEAENLYRGIDRWYDKKAKPGIISGDRVGYLVSKDGIPIGAAIARQGEDAKICTVRVREEGVNEGVGSLLFLLLAHSLRNITKKVHFTAPEHLWVEYENFFIELGFKKAGMAGIQYRLFDEEIIAEADYAVFKHNVFTKYFALYAGMMAQIDNDKIDLLLSLKPEYADRIRRKTKIMELRRKFSKKWIGKYALIYSSSPTQAIVAKVKIRDVIKDRPVAIWNSWNTAIDCTEEEFYNYTAGTSTVYGLLLDDVKDVGPFFLSSMERKIESDLRPPQSYLDLANNQKWRSAFELSNMTLQAGV